MSNQSVILGVWDGHDAGAAVLVGSRIAFAINEERLSRRKLEIGFPRKSIQACLDFAKLEANEIRNVAVSTSDFAKTLTRCFPSLREEYYLLRRRLKPRGRLNRIKKLAKYRITEFSPSRITRLVSRRVLSREIRKLGLVNASVHLVDHHAAHAATAAFCSGFDEALAITIDGIGDATSGSIWEFSNGRLELIHYLPGKFSIGIFFEHVTNLLNMRELEDEGKVMALADNG